MVEVCTDTALDAAEIKEALSSEHRPGRPIVFWVAWGELALQETVRSFNSARLHVVAQFVVFTDSESFSHPGLDVVRFEFRSEGFFRKAEVFAADLFPENADLLFLDSDTFVLGNIDFGWESSRRYGLSLVVAPTYLLDEYRNTEKILAREGMQSAGQLLYNSGVIFFSNTSIIKDLFLRWFEICVRNSDLLRGDQEALTMACELLRVNPYILSKSYNLRGLYEPVIGRTRIWHNRKLPPKNINVYDSPYPPRLLAKSKLRNLRRSETHSDAFLFWLNKRIIHPVYRLATRFSVTTRLMRLFSGR